MLVVDKIKNIENYPNNMQRNICLDEYNKAKELYEEFKKYFVENLQNVKYEHIADKIRHNANVNIERADDEFIDFIYGNEHKDGVSVFLTIYENSSGVVFSDNFDIFVEHLDYEYNVDIDEEIKII